MAEYSDVVRILTVIMGAFPSAKPLNENNFKAYHLILRDLPAEVLKQAALTTAAENTFFPSAAEVRKAALRLMEKASGVPSAQDAWAEVCRSFGSHGYYRGAPVWSHPLIGQAVSSLGGYTQLCTSDNPVADRAHFFKCYEALLSRARDDAAMLPEARNILDQMATGKRVFALTD